MSRYLHYAGPTTLSAVQASASGGTTAGACLIFPCMDAGSCLFSVQNGAGGAWTGTLQFEYSPDYLQDKSNDATALWLPLNVTPGTGGSPVTSTTANGQWFGNIGGCNAIRVRQSANAAPATSPKVTITVSEAPNPGAGGPGGGGTVLGTVSISQATPGTTNAVQAIAGTTGGAAPFSILDLQNAGVAPVKASAGQLYELFASNQANSDRWVKVYDKATAAASTDTPALRYRIPAGAVGTVLRVPPGVTFAAGIALRACTGQADNDNTAPTANDVTVSGSFK